VIKAAEEDPAEFQHVVEEMDRTAKGSRLGKPAKSEIDKRRNSDSHRQGKRQEEAEK
jgi:hypothetical protein